MTTGWRRLARGAYWGLVALIFALSVVRLPSGGPETSDKANHFAAFYSLALGAALLFPRRPLWLLAILVIGYGGMIEIVQGLPFVGRDRELMDWLTDAAAVACAVIPLAVSRLRTIDGGDKPLR